MIQVSVVAYVGMSSDKYRKWKEFDAARYYSQTFNSTTSARFPAVVQYAMCGADKIFRFDKKGLAVK